MKLWRYAALAVILLLACCAAAQADTLTLPADVQVIEASAFENDASLDEVVLPEGLLRIESRAFACSGIQRVHLPGNIEFIAEDAFEGCPETLEITASGKYSCAWAVEHHFLPERDYMIRVWVSNRILELTQAQAAAFMAAHPEYEELTVLVEAVGEQDAADSVLFDIASAADLFGFAQDQLARLVDAGALARVDASIAQTIRAENDAGSVDAASQGNVLYAYPMTSDNGYFLYYDRSVVSDPSSLEAILADCQAAGRHFYMELNSGWYQTAFFFGAGCTLTYQTDDMGEFVDVTCDYASEAGLSALKAMIAAAVHPAFGNGSSFEGAELPAAIVDGTWDAWSARQIFGSNCAAAKLPTAGGFQLGSFGGYKLMGVKPQPNSQKAAACRDLAAYLTSASAQLERFDEVGWGPSNLQAQADPDVKADPFLSALIQQSQYAVPQGQYPGWYWSIATDFGDAVLAGDFDGMDDEALMGVLTQYQNQLTAVIQ